MWSTPRVLRSTAVFPSYLLMVPCATEVSSLVVVVVLVHRVLVCFVCLCVCLFVCFVVILSVSDASGRHRPAFGICRAHKPEPVTQQKADTFLFFYFPLSNSLLQCLSSFYFGRSTSKVFFLSREGFSTIPFPRGLFESNFLRSEIARIVYSGSPVRHETPHAPCAEGSLVEPDAVEVTSRGCTSTAVLRFLVRL